MAASKMLAQHLDMKVALALALTLTLTPNSYPLTSNPDLNL